MNEDWPVARLDATQRLRVMAAALPGTAHAEIVVAAPLELAWATAADLEASLLVMLRDFRSVRVTETDTDRLRMDVRGRLGQRARFDVVLQPGWCWMQSRLWVGGIAAAAEPGQPTSTRIGFLGGLRIPGARIVGRTFEASGQRLAHQAVARLAEQINQHTAES
jgi:hypothetical protein